MFHRTGEYEIGLPCGMRSLFLRGESQIFFHLFVAHTILPMACPVTNCAMYYVYVLLSEKDGRFYTGSTNDLKRRLDEHNAGKVESTKRRKPFKLIYYEACIDEKDARKREKYLKSGMGKKYMRNRIKNYLENL